MKLPLFLWVLLSPKVYFLGTLKFVFQIQIWFNLIWASIKKKSRNVCPVANVRGWGEAANQLIAQTPSSQILWSFCNLQISTESSVHAATWEQEERKPNYEDTFEERLLYYTAHQKTLKGKATVCHRAAKRWFLKTVQSICARYFYKLWCIY